jgi:diguanylate cyclase (GGDEF)-like protein
MMSVRTMLRTAGLTTAAIGVGAIISIAAFGIVGRAHADLVEVIVIACVTGAATSLIFLFPMVRRSHLLDTANRFLSVLASTDSLTGLPNRRTFFDRAQEVAEAGREYAALMIDIDHFKLLNDRHGHAAGDEALRIVGACIRQAVEGDDSQTSFAGRIGGEEFGIVMIGAKQPTATKMAERLCQSIRQRRFEFDGQEASLTLSIGLGVGLSGPIDAGLRVADKAAYRAKASGRNQWIVGNSVENAAPNDAAVAA